MNGLGQKGTNMRKYEDFLKQKKFRCVMPLNLQFFAESEEGGTGDGAGTNSEGSGATEPKRTFDEIMSDRDYQAEFDRRVQKAIDTAKSKWQTIMDDKVSEADKLAKMNKEEKSQYLQQKKEKELADKEAAIMKKELMIEAKSTLASKDIPTELAELLSYTDAESCKKSIDTLEQAFTQSVQKYVEQKYKGGNPLKKAPQEDKATERQMLMDTISNMSVPLAERIAAKNKLYNLKED